MDEKTYCMPAHINNDASLSYLKASYLKLFKYSTKMLLNYFLNYMNGIR